jgi:hypothetical protein
MSWAAATENSIDAKDSKLEQLRHMMLPAASCIRYHSRAPVALQRLSKIVGLTLQQLPSQRLHANVCAG